MTNLRIAGAAAGVVALLVLFAAFRRGRIRRFDFSLGMLLATGMVVMSTVPSSVSALRDLLALEREQFSRLIALTVVSNVLLWALLLYTRVRAADVQGQFDRLVRGIGISEFERSMAGAISLPPVVVVIPALDEEVSVGSVIERIPRTVHGRAVRALVVDDGSRDRTLETAQTAGAMAVRNPLRRGGGAALRLGFDLALRYGAEIVVTMDADGQHLPEEIAAVVEPIAAQRADIVIGSRILGTREKDSAVRLIGIRVFNVVIRILTGIPVTDCSSGFRAIRAATLLELDLRQDQFHTSEFLIEAARRRAAIVEVPITIRRRSSGRSKKGTNVRYALGFARAILRAWWR